VVRGVTSDTSEWNDIRRRLIGLVVTTVLFTAAAYVAIPSSSSRAPGAAGGESLLRLRVGTVVNGVTVILSGGGTVHPGDRLTVGLDEATAHVAIATSDDAGNVTAVYPPGREGSGPPPGNAAFDLVVPDDERPLTLFALDCPAPVSWAGVEDAARHAAADGTGRPGCHHAAIRLQVTEMPGAMR
jgi:hypothetical protein